MKLELTEQEVQAICLCVASYLKICSNATPEPPHLTPQKEELFKQLVSVLNKLNIE
jgi:hypothetical protein